MSQQSSKPPLPTLHGERVVLRPPKPDDKQDRLAFGHHPEAARMYGDDFRNIAPMTPAEADAWYDWLLAQDFGWVMETGGRCIGEARLHHVSWQDRRARYAIGIFDPEMWGRGIGTETTRLVLRFAFEELGLHRVDLRVLEYNTRAIRSYEKCGFVREGIERESALVAGEWHSDVMMGILEQEYRKVSRAW
jgi:[ribosomal protein S5]-alanine N-acetyltransferase